MCSMKCGYWGMWFFFVCVGTYITCIGKAENLSIAQFSYQPEFAGRRYSSVWSFFGYFMLALVTGTKLVCIYKNKWPCSLTQQGGAPQGIPMPARQGKAIPQCCQGRGNQPSHAWHLQTSSSLRAEEMLCYVTIGTTPAILKVSITLVYYPLL